MLPGVTPGPRRQAFAAIVAAIRQSPDFANDHSVGTWKTWQGKNDDATPPTAAQMPAIGLRWVAGPTRRLASTRVPGGAATSASESTISLVVEVWTAGTDAGDNADVADLIHSALTPQDDAARKALQRQLGNVGLRDWHLTSEVLPQSAEGYSNASVYAVGTYAFTFQFVS